MDKGALLLGVVLAFGVILGDRPARKPGNLAPIQLISALGAWALVLANASAIAIAIRDGSLILACTAMATVAIALIVFLRNDAASIGNVETPESVKLLVADLKQLLGGAPWLGIDSLDAMVVSGRCPGIGVSVARKGVVVRVRRDVVLWLESHRRAGGAGARVVASFARFTVLHEIAHVLNGDHRTFRFVRSVLIANLMWLPGAAAAAVSLVVRGTSARPLAVAASILLVLVAQSLVARRFIAEREQLADWRAMQTLSPDDAARLLERRGRRRGVSGPTELEKLMTDLNVHAASANVRGLLSRLIAVAWPAGDDIHQRVERACGDRAGSPPRPVMWAALMGMQCGFLSLSVSFATMLAITPWIAGPVARWILLLTVMAWISAPAAMYSGLRIDPARMRVKPVKQTSRRIVVGVVFYLAFSAAGLTLYRFQTHADGALMPPASLFAVLLIAVAMVTAICTWVSGISGMRDGGGELRTMPRSSWVGEFPLLVTMVLVLVPFSVAASHPLGMPSFLGWVPIAMLSFAGYVVSTGMARSTNAVLRVLSPVALLDTPSPVYGFRLFWRDLYIDLSRTTLLRGAASAMAVHTIAMTFFVFAAASMMLALRRMLAAQTAFVVTFFSAFGVMALVLIIPDRYAAYKGPSARLLDTDRLRLFERLLAAARTAAPASADHLGASLAQWLRNDRFPAALLPAPRSVWPLDPLLILIRIARATGERVVLDRWRESIQNALAQIVSNDSVAVAPRERSSLHWTTLAATIVDEAELRDAFPFERMLDQIERLLEERFTHGTRNLLTDVLAAWRLLRRHGRPGPDPQRVRNFLRSSSLVSRPLLRQSLVELAELAALMADAELQERLRLIVRSRSWEGLQLNPRKDVLLVLDCYLAAASLGVSDAHHAAAGTLIGELADSVAADLMAVVSG
ncbi:MAG TPA: hypothetical protein VFN10_02165 [Thermoanaerobaculia bacterium]|nr:hypothetical protein [Thermoanaerobaculia bacterium]